MTITRPTFPTNNVTSKGITPTVDGSAMLEAVDKIGVDVKAYLNSLATELESTTAGNDIGVAATGVVANKLNAALTELQSNIVSAATGQIPNNSLSELKMADEMKKQAGGVAEFDTVTTLAGNLTNLSTKTDGIEEELDIMRTAKDSTGTTNAYILDTPATFDFAVDGNLVHFNPNFTNSGSATLSVDGTTKNIKKFDIVTNAYVDLEAEDIKKFNSIQLRYDVSEGSFALAPKGAKLTGYSTRVTYNRSVSSDAGGQTVGHTLLNLGKCVSFQILQTSVVPANPPSTSSYATVQGGDGLNSSKGYFTLEGTTSGSSLLLEMRSNVSSAKTSFMLSCSGIKQDDGTWSITSYEYNQKENKFNTRVYTTTFVGDLILRDYTTWVDNATGTIVTVKFDATVKWTIK